MMKTATDPKSEHELMETTTAVNKPQAQTLSFPKRDQENSSTETSASRTESSRSTATPRVAKDADAKLMDYTVIEDIQ